jgi:hypothetical protein
MAQPRGTCDRDQLLCCGGWGGGVDTAAPSVITDPRQCCIIPWTVLHQHGLVESLQCSEHPARSVMAAMTEACVGVLVCRQQDTKTCYVARHRVLHICCCYQLCAVATYGCVSLPRGGLLRMDTSPVCDTTTVAAQMHVPGTGCAQG